MWYQAQSNFVISAKQFSTSNTYTRGLGYNLKLIYPNAAYMRQWTGSALAEVMACRLVGTKSLPKPMLAYCQLDSWEQHSEKFERELYHFYSSKCPWECRLLKWRQFWSGRDEWAFRFLLCPVYSSRIQIIISTTTWHCMYTRLLECWLV